MIAESGWPERPVAPDGRSAALARVVDGPRPADGLAKPAGQAEQAADRRPPGTPDPDRPQPGDVAPRRDRLADAVPDPDQTYWEQVDRFEARWQEHLSRWPETPRATGPERHRPDDPPGSWRGDGSRYLTPDQNAEADRRIADLRRSEPEVTALLRLVQQDSPYDCHLAGLDHRIKKEARLKEKIADNLESEVISGVADAVGEINDAVRYTFNFHRDHYVSGAVDVTSQLESAGYQMFYRRNHWAEDPQYKGINTRWLTPDGGRFELQFHTFESFHAKECLTHRSYERLRSPETSRPEQRALKEYQSNICAAIPEPVGVSAIQDVREEDD